MCIRDRQLCDALHFPQFFDTGHAGSERLIDTLLEPVVFIEDGDPVWHVDVDLRDRKFIECFP